MNGIKKVILFNYHVWNNLFNHLYYSDGINYFIYMWDKLYREIICFRSKIFYIILTNNYSVERWISGLGKSINLYKCVNQLHSTINKIVLESHQIDPIEGVLCLAYKESCMSSRYVDGVSGVVTGPKFTKDNI